MRYDDDFASAASVAAFGKRLCRLAAQAVLRQVVAARFDERKRERERIARELHDTLLQGTQGLILSVHTARSKVPPDDPLQDILAEALNRAEQLMREGLDRIQNLRAATCANVDLAQLLLVAGRELAGPAQFSICVEGSPRHLDSAVSDEIALIAREALHNARRHSNAIAIEVQMIYEEDCLRLRVRDDGVGFDVNAFTTNVAERHYGLIGMRERARCIRARLDVWSAVGVGTEVELVVPCSVSRDVDRCRERR